MPALLKAASRLAEASRLGANGGRDLGFVADVTHHGERLVALPDELVGGRAQRSLVDVGQHGAAPDSAKACAARAPCPRWRR